MTLSINYLAWMLLTAGMGAAVHGSRRVMLHFAEKSRKPRAARPKAKQQARAA